MELLSIATWLAQATAPSAVKLAKQVGVKRYNEFITIYTNAFKDHVNLTEQKCTTIKTLLNRDKPLSLQDQYVNVNFSNEEFEEVTDKAILQNLTGDAPKYLISGLAGSGKSMFMKWSALNLCQTIAHHQKIPLFIEVREIQHDWYGLELDELCFRATSRDHRTDSFNRFKIGLKVGIFVLMVDGVDEAPIEWRDTFHKKLNDFSLRYPSCALICSTRPEASLENSSRLEVLHANALTLDQAIEVVQKSPFDNEKKSAFVESLQSGLFEQHKDFLSNPLLCTIMLITFDSVTTIPKKIIVFYAQVFEALFFRHDSSKGVYTRERFTDLEIDQFESVFQNFCFLTYFNEKFSFTDTEVIRFIRQALERAKESELPGNFLKDCKTSLCILQEDGSFTTFVHRSFQEYFTALFLSQYEGEHFSPMCGKLVKLSISDATFKMLCQMNPNAVARRWAIPECERLIHKYGNASVGTNEEVVSGLADLIYSIILEPNHLNVRYVSWLVGSDHAIFSALQELSRQLNLGISFAYDDMIAADDTPEVVAVLDEIVTVDEEDEEAWDIRTRNLKPHHAEHLDIRGLLRTRVNQMQQILDGLRREVKDDDDFVMSMVTS